MSNSSPSLLLTAACRLALAGAALAGTVAGAAETSRSAALTVGARVRPVARIERLEAPAALLLTDADVARGWVDLSGPVALEVRANTPGGCDLEIALDTDVALAVEVDGVGAAPVLAGSGVRVGPACASPGRTRLSLALRLHLAPGVGAGTHPFPVGLAALPRP